MRKMAIVYSAAVFRMRGSRLKWLVIVPVQKEKVLMEILGRYHYGKELH
jgi:hypothetical protein